MNITEEGNNSFEGLKESLKEWGNLIQEGQGKKVSWVLLLYDNSALSDEKCVRVCKKHGIILQQSLF